MKKQILGTLIIILASSIQANAQENNGHAYVDLGLSVKWATCNVGATKPEEKGDYFAWGETTGTGDGKVNFVWTTYKWCDGGIRKLTKYCTDIDYGVNDERKDLNPVDDVAHVKWGGSWRMPTYREMEELGNNCTWKWTEQNGQTGYCLTSKVNGESIFLPAAGWVTDIGFLKFSVGGYYWTSSLHEYEPFKANFFSFLKDKARMSTAGRYCGLSVRPVCK